MQTTLTRIFIGLESVPHGLSENWDEISRKARKFKRFSAQKQVISKKKKVFAEIETDFSAKVRNSNVFSAQKQVSSKEKKKRSSPKLRLIFRSPKFKRFFIPHHDIYFTTSAPNFLWGGSFQFFTKNRPQKHQKRASLDTSQANGGARAPPGAPGYATGSKEYRSVVVDGASALLILKRLTWVRFLVGSNKKPKKLILTTYVLDV